MTTPQLSTPWQDLLIACVELTAALAQWQALSFFLQNKRTRDCNSCPQL